MRASREGRVPALIAILEDMKRNPQYVRKMAAEALGYVGPGVAAAVPALAKARTSDEFDDSVRKSADNALWMLDGFFFDKKFVDGLAGPNATEDRRRELTTWLREKSPKIVPLVVDALKAHTESDFRAWAADVLRTFAYDPVYPGSNLHPGKTEEPWFMLDRLEKADRARARRAPDKLPVEIVPPLIDALGDKSQKVRTAAADALAIIGPEGKAAVAPLLKMIEERAGDERMAAVVALWAVGADAKLAVTPLEEATRDSDANVRRVATIALARIDPSPKRAAALLTLPRRYIHTDLIALVAHAKDAVPILVGWIGPDDNLLPASESASFTLLRLGEQAIPGLVESLKNERGGTRQSAAWILGRMGAKAKVAVESLVAALQDEELVVRAAAARALLLIDPVAARKFGLR